MRLPGSKAVRGDKNMNKVIPLSANAIRLLIPGSGSEPDLSEAKAFKLVTQGDFDLMRSEETLYFIEIQTNIGPLRFVEDDRSS